jgi:hypothetical protein
MTDETAQTNGLAARRVDKGVMTDRPQDVPERMRPYISTADLNERIPVATGPFRLVGPTRGMLNGQLVFRWAPSPALEFEGTYEVPYPEMDAPNWSLESEGELAFQVPVFITRMTTSLDASPSKVRGIVQRGFTIGQGPFDTLRFCLVNFPEYLGDPISYGVNALGQFLGRLHIRADLGECRLDSIPEAADLVRRARLDPGYVISNVGEWQPALSPMTAQQAETILQMLHFWFGLLRGAWAGPLFPEGLFGRAVVWRHLTNWNIGENRPTRTWLPQVTPLNLSSAFRGFVRRWSDPKWQKPLTTAISWFVESNSPRVAAETRIVLAQVALELLAWVHVVETQKLHSRKDFERLSAAGRIRILLQQLGIPPRVPDHLRNVPAIDDRDAFDGPGVITSVRNALVHATEQKRVAIDKLDGMQRFQCAQLALHYLELVLLALCGHDGHYARRGWEGWRGEDELQVPWMQKG